MSIQIGRWRFSAHQLLIAIVLWILVTPFIIPLKNGELVSSLLLTLLLFSAVLVVGGSSRKLLTAVILVAPAFVGKWVDNFWPGAISDPVILAVALLFIAYVVVNLFGFIFTVQRVNQAVLLVAISIYLMMGILWAFAYLFVSRLLPDAFAFNTMPSSERLMNDFNAIYFSFVTLSTVGYGDIIPTGKSSRLLAISEASAGMIYLAVVVARLVALYSLEGKQKTPEDHP